MAHYSLERRESVVRRMLNEGMSMSVLARETGIAEGTLYRWREAAKTNGEVVNKPKPHEKLSAAQKIAMVVETAVFNAAELAEHCRAKGLYPEQVSAWRTACEQATAGTLMPVKQRREARGADRRRIHELERELARKEKALAETAALLVLTKKAAAIWGQGEDA